MPRPVKRRTVQSYRRDVETLTRLQTALKLDSKLEKPLVIKAGQEIDMLMNTLIELIRSQEKE
jgi:hypothetical protein